MSIMKYSQINQLAPKLFAVGCVIALALMAGVPTTQALAVESVSTDSSPLLSTPSLMYPNGRHASMAVIISFVLSTGIVLVLVAVAIAAVLFVKRKGR